MKKILAISYSQTGQLDEITDNFLTPLTNVDVDRIKYSPVIPFPFPWTSESFFQTMPESVLEKPCALNEINYKYNQYDLIILAYQPWYLSPSIPTSSLLQNEDFLRLIKDTPVITLVGSRNMWINSQESVVRRIKDAGGKLIGNIPFIDRNQNQLSAITILDWMLTGKKRKKYHLLPLPGISDEDIKSATKFGLILDESIRENNFQNLQSRFLELGLISIQTDILFIEEKAKRIFKIWAVLIRKFGNKPKGRVLLVTAFKYYLFVALFFVAPIVVGLYQILVAPLINKSIKKKKEYGLTHKRKKKLEEELRKLRH